MSHKKPSTETIHGSRQDILKTIVNLKTEDQAPDLRSINVFPKTSVPNPFLENDQAGQMGQTQSPPVTESGTNESSTQKK